MEYRCNDCNKLYSSYQSLWIHNKKFHFKVKTECIPNVVLSIPERIPNVIQCNPITINMSVICKYCNKQFSSRQNKWNHEQKCKSKINIIEENKNLKLEIKKLKNNKLNSNKIVTQNNNINHGTINNNNNTFIIILLLMKKIIKKLKH